MEKPKRESDPFENEGPVIIKKPRRQPLPRRVLWWVMIGVIIGILGLAALINWAFTSLNTLGDAANEVMAALRDQRYGDVFEMMHEDVQARFETAGAFTAHMVETT